MKSWCYALPIGREIVFWDHDQQDYVTKTISQDYADRLVFYTNQAISNWQQDAQDLSPTYPPVIEEHEMKGKRFGDIVSAKIAGEGNKYGVYLLVDWLDSKWADIQNDESQHVSIGTVANYVDYKGRNYPVMINELSLVGSPRLKDIGKIQDHLSLRLVDAIPKQVGVQDMNETEFVEIMNALVKRVEALEAELAELKAKQGETEEQVEQVAEVVAEAVEEQALEVQAQDTEEEDEAVLKLADSLIKRAEKVAAERLKGMRLGEFPASKAPVKTDKLASAKAKGLSGMDAILASLR